MKNRYHAVEFRPEYWHIHDRLNNDLPIYGDNDEIAIIKGYDAMDEVLTRLNNEWIERAEQIAEDVKKTFIYVKSTGTWAWVDNDEIEIPESYHCGFKTRLDALMDAVEPYLDGDNS